MKTMKWLLRREFWENKGSMFWAPLIVALVMLTFIGGTVAYAAATHGIHFGDNVVINGHEMSKGAALNALPMEQRAEIANVVANSYLAASAPLFGVLPVVVFFYCLAALYDDRRDRSILFWKSLPVSDQMTVLSKVATALIVAPLITIAIGTAISMLMLFIALAAVASTGLNMFGLVLGNPAFYLAPLRLVGLLPVYVLWALPTVGWLLMVSAWARSKVFLWAVGVPLLLAALAKWANFIVVEYMGGGFDVKWFVNSVIMRGLVGLIPGSWLGSANTQRELMANRPPHGVDAGQIFSASYDTLLHPNVWIGVLAGAAMIFVAMRLRRWRDEG
jgi:ABC-2 type transport system permease protein